MRISRFWAETWPVFCKLLRNLVRFLVRFWYGGLVRPLVPYVCRTGHGTPAEHSRTHKNNERTNWADGIVSEPDPVPSYSTTSHT